MGAQLLDLAHGAEPIDFPNGLRAKLAQGAKFGRCQHLD
jgi:hypothetical protein